MCVLLQGVENDAAQDAPSSLDLPTDNSAAAHKQPKRQKETVIKAQSAARSIGRSRGRGRQRGTSAGGRTGTAKPFRV